VPVKIGLAVSKRAVDQFFPPGQELRLIVVTFAIGDALGRPEPRPVHIEYKNVGRWSLTQGSAQTRKEDKDNGE
jgi:hypothetical protein